ncbi:hypothetical protein LguiA_006591 [Lonicera macranthoides]
MATQFDRWEKDPFFSAAEEVQESADRMESTYRTWVHAIKDSSSMWNPEELRRDLQTALGTTKWQLEEFERAVRSSYPNRSIDDTKERHREFINAMESQISNVESSLHNSAASAGKPPHPWVRLDEGESNELALFLSGPASSGDKSFTKVQVKDQRTVKKPEEDDEQPPPECSKNSPHSAEWGLVQDMEKMPGGHRRTASASADISAWKIVVPEDCVGSSNAKHVLPPRRIPSFSGLLNTMESASNLKWSKYGYRKLKLPDRLQEADTTLSQAQHLSTCNNACNERSNSCLDGCDEYDKQLNGWYGVIQRQLQRSQYHMQYSRPIKLAFWTVLLVCLTVLFAVCGI